MVPDVVVEPSVAASDFPGAAFGVTGAVATAALVNATGFAGVVTACGACWITGAATASLAAAGTAIFAVAVAVAVPEAVAVAVAAAGSATAVFESVLIWADEAACAETACVLDAIAAAAIASGAVELPDAVAAGAFVGAEGTGIATATGFGVVAERPTCWTSAVRSVADVSPLADLSVDFVESVFGASLDFVWDGGFVPALGGPPASALLPLLALASEGGPALALLFGSLLAA